MYTLAGFFLAPWVIRTQLIKFMDESLGLQARIDELRVNPFTFTVTTRGFQLSEKNGGDLLGFDELVINMQSSTLFRWAWTFKEIRLTGPRAAVVLDQDGRANLEALMPAPSQTAGEDAPPVGESALPRLLVQKLTLAGGRAHLEDHTHPQVFSTEAGPISFSLTNLSTLPGDAGEISLQASLESGTRLTWEGTLSVNPLGSAGSLTVADGHMPITKRYLQDVLRFHIPGGRSHGTLNYEATLEEDQVRVRLNDSSIGFSDFVAATEDDIELLRLPELEIKGLDLQWPERIVTIRDVTFATPVASVWRNADGSLNILRHLGVDTTGAVGQAGEPSGTSGEVAESDTWQLSVDRLKIRGLGVSLEDRTVEPAFSTGVEDLDLEITDIDNAPGSTFPFELSAKVTTGGSAQLSGQVGMLPQPSIETAISLTTLALIPVQPYLDGLAQIRLDSGSFSLEGSLSASEDEMLTFSGTAELADLVAQDTYRDEQLLGLHRVAAEDLLLDMTAGRLGMTRLTLEKPYGRLTIYKDGTTNIGNVLTVDPRPEDAAAQALPEPPPAAGAESPTEPAMAARPMNIQIDEVRLIDGSADFTDLSLILPFSSRIDSLQGTVTEMVSGGTAARINLEGTVDEHGLARVEGGLDFFAPDRRSDVQVAFRNVEMSQLSPYTTQFAGYAVEGGRLSLDLRYHLEDRRLESENQILVDQLTLGEKIESPDAPNLPVKLAVAMLKDKNGRIELDLPISGTLDDPEFAYGQLAWKALKNVMAKVATAPFRALARLIGSDKDLEFVEFAAAESDITPPAREVLDGLTQALMERPELMLEVKGVFDPENDAATLRVRKLETTIDQRTAALEEQADGEQLSAVERTRMVMEELFREQFTAEDLVALAAAHTRSATSEDGKPMISDPVEDAATPPDAPDTSADAANETPVLDLPAYLDAMRQQLVTAQHVSDAELVQLADARSASINDYLNQDGTLIPDRVTVIAGEAIKKKDAGSNWIRLRLIITTDKMTRQQAKPPQE